MIEKEKLQRLSKYLSIVHHSKNRIRLRVSLAITKEANDISLNVIDELPKKIDGINDIKINKLIGSITINYDSSVFASKLWDELVSGEFSDELLSKFDTILKDD